MKVIELSGNIQKLNSMIRRTSVRKIDLLEVDIFDPFHATDRFLYSLYISENQGFLMFSFDIEKYQRHALG